MRRCQRGAHRSTSGNKEAARQRQRTAVALVHCEGERGREAAQERGEKRR
jgi:hypothetical protein